MGGIFAAIVLTIDLDLYNIQFPIQPKNRINLVLE